MIPRPTRDECLDAAAAALHAYLLRAASKAA